MTRARKVSNEESNDSRKQINSVTSGDSENDEAIRANDSALHSTLDGIHPREDLRHCVLCGKNDIVPEQFRSHILREHPRPVNQIPQGYYECWSGGEFFHPVSVSGGPCKWVCSVCGKVKWYYGYEGSHGGPPTRLLDRRYGLSYCEAGRYPGHKRYLGRIDGKEGPVVFYHEGAPNPTQPEQPEDGISKENTIEKVVSKRAKPATGSEGNNASADRLPVGGKGESVRAIRRTKEG